MSGNYSRRHMYQSPKGVAASSELRGHASQPPPSFRRPFEWKALSGLISSVRKGKSFGLPSFYTFNIAMASKNSFLGRYGIVPSTSGSITYGIKLLGPLFA